MSGLAAFAALSGVSTGFQVLGNIQQGKAAQKAAEFQARVQEQQANAERQAAAAEAEDFRRRFSRRRAGNVARLGGSGVDIAGSPLLVFEDFEREAALQSSRLLNIGDVRATRLEQQADLTRAGGRSARRAGTLRAGQSLLSGGASLLSGLQRFG